MCLSNIKEIDLDKDDGYVVVKYNNHDNKIQARYGSDRYLRNRKYEAENLPSNRQDLIDYLPGFHYFPTLEDAKSYNEYTDIFSDQWSSRIYKARFYNVYVEGEILIKYDSLDKRVVAKSRVAKFRVLKSEVKLDGKR